MLGGVSKKNVVYDSFDRNKNLTLGEGDVELLYNPKHLKKETYSFKKLKIFLSHMLFINLYWNSAAIQNPVLIVVGEFTELLSEYYPQFTYHIYNKNNNVNKNNIIYHNEEFNPENWTEQEVFFICEEEFEKCDDEHEEEKKNIDLLNKEKEWFIKLNPVKAMLKVRLPYNYKWQPKKTIEYLSGLFYLRQWADDESTELSFVPNYEIMNYDIKKYESMNFYHRKITRGEKKFYNVFNEDKTPISTSIGLYNDYDSTVTSYIIYEYLNKHSVNPTTENCLILLKHILTSVEPGNSLIKIRIEQ